MPSAGQGEIRSLTFGTGTDYDVPAPGIGGLDVRVRAYDVPSIVGGVAAGYDVHDAGEILIPLQVTDMALIDDIRAAFRPARTGEIQLDLAHPGVLDGAVSTFYGRPRGVTVDLTLAAIDYVRTLGVFVTTDPLIYGPAVSSAVDSSSPLTIAAATLGPEDTDRLTVTVVGNAGTPTITNTTTGGVIDFAAVLDTADVAVIDVHDRTVTVEAVAAPTAIDVASTWFGFAGGVENTITFTGCASVQITYRPAYP